MALAALGARVPMHWGPPQAAPGEWGAVAWIGLRVHPVWWAQHGRSWVAHGEKARQDMGTRTQRTRHEDRAQRHGDGTEERDRDRDERQYGDWAEPGKRDETGGMATETKRWEKVR